MDIKLHRLTGPEARSYVNELAHLRLRIFWDFPYLYEGNLDYERDYLETYFKAKHSRIFLVEALGQIVGATTAIWAHEEVDSFREPFLKFGLDPQGILYFGESILLPEWRGKGLGKLFFEERENFGQSLPFIETYAFCAVKRPADHPLRPSHYKPLDEFWLSQGYRKEQGLVTHYEWKDRDEKESTEKLMEFWLKVKG